LTFNFSATCSC